jgi:pyruvate ferredoxin oxidoreductase gamma subunit
MFVTRIHGWGGQGVGTFADLLAVAAYTDGRYAVASPGFGPEHTGDPAVAFCRIDDRPLVGQEPATEPDAVIIQDVALPYQVDVFAGLRPAGYVLINSHDSAADLGLDDLVVRSGPDRLLAVPATDIARREAGRPSPNAALTGIVTLRSVETAIRERFAGRLGEDNVEAARDGFAFAQYQRRQLSAG